jgi:dipeptidyl aminopeptidase/acylaminoacyl peptidase
MNAMTDLEQALRVHFDNHADPTARDGQLDRVTDRIATVRQRPGWTIPERWLPMSAISARFAAAPRLPVRVLVLALLVLALAVSALLIAGALRHSVPPPFGPAANGLIAYADNLGAINVGDPVTGTSKVVVPGPGNGRPIFSPDGTHIAFDTSGARGGKDLIVVRADGSSPVKLTTESLTSVGFLGWSPDSVSVVVGNSAGELVAFDSTHVGPPTSLGTSAGSDDYNANTAELYQPPAGQKVLTQSASSPHPSLVVTDRDGTNEHVLIDGTQADAFMSIQSPQWSPDGSMISFVGARRDVAEDYFAYVMNADGSGLRPLSKASRPINESNPAWAPDSKRIALQRWFIDPTAGTQEVRPITVVDVLTGDEVEVGVTPVSNGFVGWSWSPDGESILEIPTDDELYIANVGSGTTRKVPWTLSTSGPSWQRVAP